MRRNPEGPKFARETDLCAAFIAAIDERRWTCYGETAGWDILAVRKDDGAQVGIEAKLRLNPEVVAQALPHKRYSDEGPDYRAVLVPAGGAPNSLHPICAALGVTVLTYVGEQNGTRSRGRLFHPRLPDEGVDPEYDWHQWAPLRRCRLPDYVPDVAAGSSAPIALTQWKIQAIKLAVVLEERPLTRADFKAAKVSIYRWIDPSGGWLKSVERGVYAKGDRFPDFAAQHPRNYAEIKADKTQWMWASPKQGALL